MAIDDKLLVAVLCGVEAGMEPSFKKEFAACAEDSLSKYHHSWGRHLRNTLHLWVESPLSQYFKSMGVWHADDMSGILMTSLWRRLHGKPIQLKEQVAYYQEYWATMKKAEGGTFYIDGHGKFVDPPAGL